MPANSLSAILAWSLTYPLASPSTTTSWKFHLRLMLALMCVAHDHGLAKFHLFCALTWLLTGGQIMWSPTANSMSLLVITCFGPLLAAMFELKKGRNLARPSPGAPAFVCGQTCRNTPAGLVDQLLMFGGGLFTKLVWCHRNILCKRNNWFRVGASD